MKTPNPNGQPEPQVGGSLHPDGSVWLITYHSQDGENCGVHGVFAAEADAKTAASRMNRVSRSNVYRASQWTITPNAKLTDSR